jgi:hypothetical protein
MNIFRLPFSALYRTLRRPGLLATLYAMTLLLTLPLALAFRNVLQTAMADSGAYESLLYDFQFTIIADFLKQYGSRVASLFTTATLFALFAVPLNSFLSGGILTVLRESEGRFSLVLFFSGCARYFGRFLRLLLIFTGALIVLFSLGAIVLGMSIAAVADRAESEVPIIGMSVAGGVVLAVVFVLLMMVVDYAKVIAVDTSSSRMFKVAGQAAKFVWKNFFRVLAIHVILILFALVFTGVYFAAEGAVGMVSPMTVLLGMVFQQLFIVGRSWFRSAFFAAELGLYQSVVVGQAPIIDTPPPPAESAPLYA